MNDEKLVLTRAAIYEVGLLFNQTPSEDKIKAYSKALANYTPKQITFAFNQVILSGSAFFPSLAEILGHLKPREVSSREIGDFVANEVIQKTLEFGCHRLDLAYAALSDVSKKTLGDNRYLLTEIANSDKDQLTSIRAQIRDMAKSASEIHKQTTQNAKLNQLGINTGKVLEFRTMDYSNFLESKPGDPA